ncbi:MAG: hypothetical protein GY755_16780, partial [Chloroflexi bacterium]|nr:hypothetical protein [Chloroflexota bacterium]
MEYLNPTACSNSNNCDVLKYNDFHFSNSKTDKKKWDDLFNGELVTDKYIISDTSENYIEIEYYLKSIGNEGVFEIKIIECSADESGGAYTQMEQSVKGKYNNCQTLLEYHTIQVQIINNEEDDTFITQNKCEMPMWVWYPIIGIALAIPLLKCSFLFCGSFCFFLCSNIDFCVCVITFFLVQISKRVYVTKQMCDFGKISAKSVFLETI